jgi:diguanylate cyclase (GGDEF)-like protein
LVQIYPTESAIGSRYTLTGATVTLGREHNCDIRLNDKSVSRLHARIQPGPDGYYLTDLQSTNGTCVNDLPVSTAKLQNGDYLRLGDFVLRYLQGSHVEAAYHDEVRRLTTVDPLTGVHNKRYLLECLDREFSRAHRHQRPLAVVLFDLDQFKAVNDRMGHLCGDYTLRELVSCAQRAIRKEDLLARFGGDEFLVLLPETNQEGAVCAAERLRQRVEQHAFQFEDHSYHLSISLGIAVKNPEDTETATDLIRRADDKLYEAKGAGRNRLAV